MTSDGPQPPKERELGAEEIEMNEMTSQEEDISAADEPLIPQSQDPGYPCEPSSDQSLGNVFIWTLTLSAALSSMLFGYDTGVISSTLVSIGTDLSSRELTTLDKSLVTSATSFFALIASPISGVLADNMGRKRVILFADILFTAGALWQAVASSVWEMILGRGLVGLAIGGASPIVPLYISELSPSHLRGRLVTVSPLFTTGGQVVAYVIGWLFSSMPGGWRWMVGIGAFPAITQLALLVFMPETPRFLMRVGREDSAKLVLAKVYKSKSKDVSLTAQVTPIIRAIKRELLEEEQAKIALKSTSTQSKLIPPTLHSLLFNPPHVRALTIACMLQGLQQLCGFNSLMYFSATIFSLLRFSSPTLTSLSIAITNFLFTIAAFHLIDRIGRRRILLITIPVMVLALLLCAAAFTFTKLPNHSGINNTEPSSDVSNSRLPAIAILVSLILYVSPYATGLGSVPWQQSELFPLAVRSLGSSLATATNWGCNTVVGLTFLPMMEFLTPGWTFVCYALICAVGWVAVWAIYPETKGLALEDIGELLKDGWGVRESVDRSVRVLDADSM